MLFFPSLLPAPMAGYSDPLGSQTSPAQMMDTGLMGAFSGIAYIVCLELPLCNTDTDTATLIIAGVVIIIWFPS